MDEDKLIQGTIFGNLKIPKLGTVEVTYLDNSVEVREINELGTTVFPGNLDRHPYLIKIFGKTYNIAELPAIVDLEDGTTTNLHEFPFGDGDATIILLGLPDIPEALRAK